MGEKRKDCLEDLEDAKEKIYRMINHHLAVKVLVLMMIRVMREEDFSEPLGADVLPKYESNNKEMKYLVCFRGEVQIVNIYLYFIHKC